MIVFQEEEKMVEVEEKEVVEEEEVEVEKVSTRDRFDE